MNNSAFALEAPRASPILTRMRKAIDDMHWEELVRTMIERLGADRLAEVIDYVLEQADHADLMDMDEPPAPLTERSAAPPP